MKHLSLAVVVLLPFLAGPFPASAAGETWRYPETYPAVEGPSVLEITPADTARFSSRARRRGESLPSIEVLVLEEGKTPASGVGVAVGARVGKRSRDTIRLTGATDRDGRLLLRSTGTDGMTEVAFDFYWHGGYRSVGASLEPDGGGWRIAEATYADVIGDGEDQGRCENLFRLEPAGEANDPGRLRLVFYLPASLLECREVVYGSGRKSAELAKVAQIGHRDLNAGDKNFFSRRDEEQMGLEAARELDNELEFVQDPAIVDYVKDIVKKVVASSDDPTMPVDLHVVHTDDINAFATAGGHVYVFTGLISVAENESQLAGVLAHEISHVIGRHVTEGATHNMKIQVGTLLGSLALGQALDLKDDKQKALVQGSLLTAGVVGMKYSRSAETEADLLGTQYLWNGGWDPEAIALFFEMMEKRGLGAGVPGWLSDHPTDEKRVENGLHWARAFLPERDRYLVDTERFQEVRARVRALPPPRKKPAAAEGQGLQEILGRTDAFHRAVDRELPALLGLGR